MFKENMLHPCSKWHRTARTQAEKHHLHSSLCLSYSCLLCARRDHSQTLRQLFFQIKKNHSKSSSSILLLQSLTSLLALKPLNLYRL